MAHLPKTSGNFANLSLLIKSQIMLVENEKVVSENEEIAYLFNTYFNDITKGLNIEIWLNSNLPCKDNGS